MVAREPFPVHPVLDHILAIAPTLLTLAIPKHILVPINRATSNLADHALHDLLIRLHIAALVMTLCSGNDTQVLSRCLFSCRHDRPVTNRIHTDRFLQERMLTLLCRVLEMHRAEERRCRDDHHIHATIDHLLISIEPNEALVGRDVDALLVFQLLGQLIHTLLERIAQSRNGHAIRRVQEIERRARATSAASDDTRFQLFSVCRQIRQFRNIIRSRLTQRLYLSLTGATTTRG